MRPISVDENDPRTPKPIRARLRVMVEHGEHNVATAHARIGREQLDEFGRRLSVIVHSKESTWARLQALYALADEHMAAIAPNIACRTGCAHCCYIGVTIPVEEANMLGRAISRQPQQVTDPTVGDKFDFGYDNPCTFLVENKCSIYEHRPLLCRVHANYDDDATLCHLKPPFVWNVPYADMTPYKVAWAMICEGSTLADIRDYFPRQ